MISDVQWFITWPFVTLLTILTGLLSVLKRIKMKEEVWVLIIWVVFYFGFFSLGEISSRYFVILIPILYVIALFGVIEISKRIFLHENK